MFSPDSALVDGINVRAYVMDDCYLFVDNGRFLTALNAVLVTAVEGVSCGPLRW